MLELTVNSLTQRQLYHLRRQFAEDLHFHKGMKNGTLSKKELDQMERKKRKALKTYYDSLTASQRPGPSRKRKNSAPAPTSAYAPPSPKRSLEAQNLVKVSHLSPRPKPLSIQVFFNLIPCV